MIFSINREEREALHSEAILSFSDMTAALEDDDWEMARRLRPSIEAVSRLLDDIGWGAVDDGESFVITVARPTLALALYHLSRRTLSRVLHRPKDDPDTDAIREDLRLCSLLLSLCDRRPVDVPRLIHDRLDGQMTPARARLDVLPRSPLSFSREQRDQLRLRTVLDLGPLSDSLPLALRTGDYEHAREVRVALEADWFLLDEIGWQPEDPREEFEVYLPEIARARARARLAWIERERPSVPSIQRFGPLEIDARKRTVALGGAPISLTPVEFSLLRTLASDPERVFDKRELQRLLWGHRTAQSRTLDSHAVRLRRKLGRDGDTFVVNLRGVGYSLLPAHAPVCDGSAVGR